MAKRRGSGEKDKISDTIKRMYSDISDAIKKGNVFGDFRAPKREKRQQARAENLSKLVIFGI